MRCTAVAGEWHDITWLKELEVELELPYIQYQTRDPLEPHYYVNNANEAGAYLRFIHEYYDCLPAVCIEQIFSFTTARTVKLLLPAACIYLLPQGIFGKYLACKDSATRRQYWRSIQI